MKTESSKSQIGIPNDLPDAFSTAAFRKKNKKRMLPEAFYPRWELELLSSFVGIFILWILPDWISDIDILLSSRFDVTINSSLVDLAGKIVMAGFITSFIVRVIWLRLVWKWQADRSSHGEHMFKRDMAQEMRRQFAGRRKLATTLDELAEIVFFISSIVLFITLLSYLIHVLGSLLHHSISTPQDTPGIK